MIFFRQNLKVPRLHKHFNYLFKTIFLLLIILKDQEKFEKAMADGSSILKLVMQYTTRKEWVYNLLGLFGSLLLGISMP